MSVPNKPTPRPSRAASPANGGSVNWRLSDKAFCYLVGAILMLLLAHCQRQPQTKPSTPYQHETASMQFTADSPTQ